MLLALGRVPSPQPPILARSPNPINIPHFLEQKREFLRRSRGGRNPRLPSGLPGRQPPNPIEPALGMAPIAAEADEASGPVKTRSSARRLPPRGSRPSVQRHGGNRDGGGVASLESQSAARAERHKRRSAKRLRTLADQSSEGERAAKKVDLGVQEEKVAPPLASGVEEGVPLKEDEASSACSSPLRKPYIPRVVIGRNAMGREIYKPIEGEDFDAFDPWEAKYQAKRDHQMELPTLLPRIPDTCLTDRRLLHIRESATKTILHAAKFVVGLSSFIAGKSLSQSSGFMIDWNDKSRTGIIMTSALLICKESRSLDDWKSANQYASDAEVVVRFVDGTTLEGHFLYCQEHYNLAFYKIVVDRSIHLPSFSEGVKWAEEVFILGRDGSSYLRTSYGRVQYLNAHGNERHHYMYIDGFDAPPEYYNGGPVIDLRGDVVGMSTRSTRGSFIPSNIILKCLQLWRKFQCIPRPHLQLKFWGMKFLNPVHVEVISCKCNIDEGLIVKEVSAGSIAERLGVRVGDVIEFFNGESISATVELEKMLLQISEDHLDKGNGLDSKIDIEIGVFHTRKGVRSIQKLTVHVSDKGEVVVRGEFPVTRETIYARCPHDQADPDSDDSQIPLTDRTSSSRSLDSGRVSWTKLHEKWFSPCPYYWRKGTHLIHLLGQGSF